jgi:hypothetical protein
MLFPQSENEIVQHPYALVQAAMKDQIQAQDEMIKQLEEELAPHQTSAPHHNFAMFPHHHITTI